MTEEDSSADEEDIAKLLEASSEAPVGHILWEKTLQVKPVKYSHYSEDPSIYREAVSCDNSSRWRKAVDNKLENIEDHKVWLDEHEKLSKHLNSTWVFKTKPATTSSPEKQKARLCIQGFIQTYSEDFFENFSPTGKFSSLLMLLVLAIDPQAPCPIV